MNVTFFWVYSPRIYLASKMVDFAEGKIQCFMIFRFDFFWMTGFYVPASILYISTLFVKKHEFTIACFWNMSLKGLIKDRAIFPNGIFHRYFKMNRKFPGWLTTLSSSFSLSLEWIRFQIESIFEFTKRIGFHVAKTNWSQENVVMHAVTNFKVERQTLADAMPSFCRLQNSSSQSFNSKYSIWIEYQISLTS